MTKERIDFLTKKLLEEADLNQEYGILRKFMSSDEIKVANILVKKDLFNKGICDVKHGTVTFFISHKGLKTIENDK